MKIDIFQLFNFIDISEFRFSLIPRQLLKHILVYKIYKLNYSKTIYIFQFKITPATAMQFYAISFHIYDPFPKTKEKKKKYKYPLL